MAAWLPAIKAILPYVAQIVTDAIPAFTNKNGENEKDVVAPNQISELQEAVTHNAESLRVLAIQLQQVISGIDAGSAKAEKEIKTVKWISILAIVISVVAIALWLITWLR
jgi:protein-S-isoprenylcysteine O-methyltransferase Ste14